jgi:hypothetical protein
LLLSYISPYLRCCFPWMPNNDPTPSLTDTAALLSALYLLCCPPPPKALPTPNSSSCGYCSSTHDPTYILCCFPWMLNNKQTPPPLKATAALPKTLPTLLLPSNALTITKLPLLHLLLFTLQTYTYLLLPLNALPMPNSFFDGSCCSSYSPTYTAAYPVHLNNDLTMTITITLTAALLTALLTLQLPLNDLRLTMTQLLYLHLLLFFLRPYYIIL